MRPPAWSRRRAHVAVQDGQVPSPSWAKTACPCAGVEAAGACSRRRPPQHRRLTHTGRTPPRQGNYMGGVNNAVLNSFVQICTNLFLLPAPSLMTTVGLSEFRQGVPACSPLRADSVLSTLTEQADIIPTLGEGSEPIRTAIPPPPRTLFPTLGKVSKPIPLPTVAGVFLGTFVLNACLSLAGDKKNRKGQFPKPLRLLELNGRGDWI